MTSGPSLHMRQAAPDSQTQSGGAGSTAPAATATAASEIARETQSPSAQEVAERVYHLFCESLRRDRERHGSSRQY